ASASSGSPVLRDVRVDNYDNASHTVSVLVVRNDSVVFWTTRRIGSKRQNASVGTVVDGATVDPPEIAKSTERFTVFVQLDDRTSGVRYSTRGKSLSSCYSVRFAIRDGRLSPGIGHWNDAGEHCADSA
ncbi:hypothetical protein, partial [Halorussus sp. GCM10023401]